MVAKEIKSLQHRIVKHWVQLRKSSRVRREEKKIILVGEKILSQMDHVETLLTQKECSFQMPCKEHYILTEPIMHKITGLTGAKAAAVVNMPPFADLSQKEQLLILDEISDPGNMGTLLRTALAMKIDGVAFTPNTVDPFNDKALRAAKGASIRLPLACLSDKEIKDLLFHRNVYVADVRGKDVHKIKFSKPWALILSNEARGPREWTETYQKITIPMAKKVESLNVAAAGSILIYIMGK